MKKKSMAVVIVATCDTQCAVGGLTVVDVDPSPELVSLDFLRGCCCSYSGGASDCAATDEDTTMTRCPHRTSWESSLMSSWDQR